MKGARAEKPWWPRLSLGRRRPNLTRAQGQPRSQPASRRSSPWHRTKPSPPSLGWQCIHAAPTTTPPAALYGRCLVPSVNAARREWFLWCHIERCSINQRILCGSFVCGSARAERLKAELFVLTAELISSSQELGSLRSVYMCQRYATWPPFHSSRRAEC